VLVRLAASPAPRAYGSAHEVRRGSGWRAVPTTSYFSLSLCRRSSAAPLFSSPLCRPPGPPRTRRRRGRQGGGLRHGAWCLAAPLTGGGRGRRDPSPTPPQTA
jgi:hypothetical protein